MNPELGAWVECLITVGPNGRTTSTRCRGTTLGFEPAGTWQPAVAPSCRVSGRKGGDARLVGAMSADGQSFTAVALDEEGGFGPRVIDKTVLFDLTFHRR